MGNLMPNKNIQPVFYSEASFSYNAFFTVVHFLAQQNYPCEGGPKSFPASIRFKLQPSDAGLVLYKPIEFRLFASINFGVTLTSNTEKSTKGVPH